MGLDALRATLRNIRNQLEQLEAKKQGYLNTAAEVETVYNRMADDKAMVIEYRNSINTFLNEEFDTFRGNLYSETYRQKMGELVAGYDTVINNLDINMDLLNTARAQYENQAYQCDGPIGYLRSSINSVVHQIENWVN